jgi:steroid delta-isomerase-like uncharacterized protein
MNGHPTCLIGYGGHAVPAGNGRLLLVGLLAVVLAACAEESPSNTTLGPDRFGRAWIEAWDSQEVERILSYYADDAFYEDVPNVENGWAAPMRGHDMIRESLVETFAEMPDLGFDFVSASAAGDRMVVEWIMQGTRYRDVSGRFSIRGVSVIKLDGGKIISVSDYYDAYLLLSQLGMLPALNAGQEEASSNPAGR